MSGKRIWWLLVILFLVATTAGLFLEFFFAGNQNQKIDIDQLEQSVQKRQMSLNKMLKQFPDSLLDLPEAAWAYMDSVSGTDNEMLIFYDNELVAWSDQRLPVQDIHPVFFTQPFIVLDNGYYLVQHFRYNSYSLVGLYRIKYSFPYQNKYLHDRFVLPSGLSPSVRIVRDQGTSWQPVFGLEGEYLFSVSDLSLKKSGSTSEIYVFFAYLLSVFALWGLLFMWLRLWCTARWINLRLLLTVVLYAVFFYFVFWHSGMSAFSSLGLFSPGHFAMSDFLPSLGALLLFAICILLASFFIFRFFRWPDILPFRSQHRVIKGGVFFAFIVVIQLWMLFLIGLIYRLVEHSSSPSVFYKVVEINEIAVVKIVIVAFLFFSILLIAEKLVRLYLFRMERWTMSVLILLATVVSIFVSG
jgi:two-component system nitrogen regulation sensor histidine kinase NtrY